MKQANFSNNVMREMDFGFLMMVMVNIMVLILWRYLKYLPHRMQSSLEQSHLTELTAGTTWNSQCYILVLYCSGSIKYAADEVKSQLTHVLISSLLNSSVPTQLTTGKLSSQLQKPPGIQHVQRI